MEVRICFRVLLLAFTFWSSVSNAFVGVGGMDSGGGHGVACFANATDAQYVRERLGYIPDHYLNRIDKIEFLDYYLATQPTGMRAADLPLVDDSDFASGVELYYFLKERLQASLPELYMALDYSEKFFERTGITWAPIADAPLFDTGLPSFTTDSRCVLILMAYQIHSKNQHYLQIDGRLYNHTGHRKLSQAALFLHEFLYLKARQSGSDDSRSVALVVRLLIAARLDIDRIREISENLRIL